MNQWDIIDQLSLFVIKIHTGSVKRHRLSLRAALQNAGVKIPNRRITINLAPADLPKESG